MHDAMAVDELLDRSGWRMVRLVHVLNQLERRSELCMQRVRGVANNREAAALGRPIRTECRHDDMSARANSTPDLFDIRRSLFHVCEKMENGTVVPDVVRLLGEFDPGYVSFDPVHAPRSGGQPLTRYAKSRRGDVEHRDIETCIRCQIVHKR